MKKRFKSRFRTELGETALEIILSLIFLGIGAMVLALFGVSGDAEWLDGDLVLLIGIGAIIVPTGIIFAVIHAVRKRKKQNVKKIEINNKTNLKNTERKDTDHV